MPNYIGRLPILGHLTKDPELRYTPSGTEVCSFGIAVNEKWKDASGGYKDKAHFFNMVMFGKRAETINAYFKKGSPIFIECQPQFEEWETKDGQKRSNVKFKVTDFQFVGAKGEKKESQEPQRKSEAEPFKNTYDPDVNEEDIPF